MHRVNLHLARWDERAIQVTLLQKLATKRVARGISWPCAGHRLVILVHTPIALMIPSLVLSGPADYAYLEQRWNPIFDSKIPYLRMAGTGPLDNRAHARNSHS